MISSELGKKWLNNHNENAILRSINLLISKGIYRIEVRKVSYREVRYFNFSKQADSNSTELTQKFIKRLMAKLVILTEGMTNPSDGKLACAVLRYRTDEVVALIDSTIADGQKTCGDVLNGLGGDIPIYANLDGVEGDTFVIGIAPAGGKLPESWRPVLTEAIRRGMTVLNGLHVFFNDDPELSELAQQSGAEIHDVRCPPDDLTVSENIAKDTPCFRVHTVGEDCNVGKMSAALELDAGLQNAGKVSRFIATGQTGIVVCGKGLPIDRVISDFVAGATERLILEDQDAEFLLVEGQGSLIHPLYSGVTLGLLHGCAPQAMVFCYDANRKFLRHCPDFPIPPLEELIQLYETSASYICPSKVVGICANTSQMTAEEAEREIKTTEDRLQRPVNDPYRYGVQNIVEAIIQAKAQG